MWQRATTMTATLFPGICFGFFLILNVMAWWNESSDKVPFTTLLVLVFLWLLISAPLVYLGAYFGYKQEAIEFPVNTSSIPRQIPDQPWFMMLPFTLFVGGILPFGSCFVELYYILASVWQEYYYYVFGFLLLVFFILIVTCAEITVLFTYFQLCSENYYWWWRAFGNAGSTALWVFLYSIVYFQQLEANSFVTYVLYFGYMGLICLGMFCMVRFCGLCQITIVFCLCCCFEFVLIYFLSVLFHFRWDLWELHAVSGSIRSSLLASRLIRHFSGFSNGLL
jgi:transmembrane 9 superfamily protein 2/4